MRACSAPFTRHLPGRMTCHEAQHAACTLNAPAIRPRNKVVLRRSSVCQVCCKQCEAGRWRHSAGAEPAGYAASCVRSKQQIHPPDLAPAAGAAVDSAGCSTAAAAATALPCPQTLQSSSMQVGPSSHRPAETLVSSAQGLQRRRGSTAQAAISKVC